MWKTKDYLDAARELAATRSDYALAKLLGITESAVNNYRKGDRVIDNYTALRLSEVLGKPLEDIIAAAELEREQDANRKSAWRTYLKTKGKQAAAVLLAMVATAALHPGGTSEARPSIGRSASDLTPATTPVVLDRSTNYATSRRRRVSHLWAALAAALRACVQAGRRSNHVAA